MRGEGGEYSVFQPSTPPHRFGGGGPEGKSLLERVQVHNEWIGGGAFLGGEYFSDGGFVECVCAETVDGFGGEGYEMAREEAFGGGVEGGKGGGDVFCFLVWGGGRHGAVCLGGAVGELVWWDGRWRE